MIQNTYNQTIIEGDCQEKMKNLPDNSVDLIITSPPYADQRKKTYGGIKPEDYVNWFMPIADEMKRVLKPTGSFVLNIKEKVVNCERSTYVLELILAMKKHGWLWIEEYIWDKTNAMPGKWKLRFRDEWERLLHFTKSTDIKMIQEAVKKPIGDWVKKYVPKEKYNNRIDNATNSGFGTVRNRWQPDGTVFPSNVLRIPVVGKNKEHPAVFPDGIPEFFIKLFTEEGDVVLDPFLGSGTTLVVAKRLNRNGIGIEKVYEYVELSKKNLEN